METLSNVASNASKMIWGDNTNTANTAVQSGTEPLSGETGRGTATDPYDAGNKEENIQSDLPVREKRSDSAHSLNPSSDKLKGPVHPEHETEKTGVTSIHKNDPHGQDVRPSEANEDRPNTNVGGFGTVEPSVGADPKSAQKPMQKQQGADRPSDEPSGEQTDAIKDDKDNVEDAMKKRDPNDHSGEPMKMHDGKENTNNESKGPEDGPEEEKKSEEDGTGEKWIKTSGMAADGGDFDAAQAGAGREADRLLETKGVERSSGSDDSRSPPPVVKPSMGKKLKEKLHIGKNKN